MATVTGLGTTFTLPNYTGELFNTSVQDAPLLSMIGGLSGGMETQSVEFEWEAETLRTPTLANVQLEGAAAPTATAQSRTNIKNVVEIHQSQISISYTKLGATQQKAGVNNAERNPITDELSHQIGLETKTTAREVNLDMWYGVKAVPANNSTARKMDGLASVIVTNVFDASAGNALTGATPTFTTATTGVFTSTAHGLTAGSTVVFDTLVTTPELTVGTPYYVTGTTLAANTYTVSKTKGGAVVTFAATGSGTAHYTGVVNSAGVLDCLASIFQNGGLTDSESYTVWSNAWNKRILTKAFITDSGYRQESRTVGGVSVQSAITDFGTLDFVVDRTLNPTDIFITTTSELAPVFLNIPGKGHFFAEELAQTGASLNYQLYGEVGLKYGAEQHHGRIKNTTAW